MLRLYNTLSRSLEPLAAEEGGEIKVYCCGPTVYDVPHAGHARAALAPDVLVRLLGARGVRVTYVRNITDVDDKILERSRKNGESPLELASRMTRVYQEQISAVGCLAPTHEPRVSDHLPQIFALIEQLIANGNAYVVDMDRGTRDVYFSVRSFDGYGKLSRRKLDELIAGARVEKDEHKRDPLDFALWKGEQPEAWGWDSPWGRGRPGWHIECSAMSLHYLGSGFDVHAGGMDLIFPHHENEIAQSEAARPGQAPFARLWLHNGFVNVDKDKMSKSLGNFVTVSDVLARNDAEAFRWFLLGAHYRGPIQFDTEKLEDGRVVFPGVDEAERRVDYLYGAYSRVLALGALASGERPELPADLALVSGAVARADAQAGAALDDDLNTPVALAALGELLRFGNELCDLAVKRRKDAAWSGAAAHVAAEISAAAERVAGLLGVLRASPEEYRARTRARRLTLRGLGAERIDALVAERAQARAAKDFARGDQLRAELAALGVTLHDGPSGTEWSVAQ